MENTIKETTRLLLQGNLTKAEADKILMDLHIGNAMPSAFLEDEGNEPYCTDCGNDDLAYIDQYANGNYWKCKECGKEFIH